MWLWLCRRAAEPLPPPIPLIASDPGPLPLQYKEALGAYQEALAYSPGNKVAQSRADFCRTRLERLRA